MSIVINCDTGTLTLDDIFRLVAAVDADGNIYLRVYDDETAPTGDLVDCESGDITVLDIFRGALVTNDDGDYALNIIS